MKNKMYAKCNIFYTGEQVYSKENFEALVEYRDVIIRDESGKERLVSIGNDLITGTPFISVSPWRFDLQVSKAVGSGLIKRRRLLAYNFTYTNPLEMINQLQSMSEEDIKKYVEKIEEIKSSYSLALRNSKINSIIKKRELKELDKYKEKYFGLQKRRIRNIVNRLFK